MILFLLLLYEKITHDIGIYYIFISKILNLVYVTINFNKFLLNYVYGLKNTRKLLQVIFLAHNMSLVKIESFELLNSQLWYLFRNS